MFRVSTFAANRATATHVRKTSCAQLTLYGPRCADHLQRMLVKLLEQFDDHHTPAGVGRGLDDETPVAARATGRSLLSQPLLQNELDT